MNVLDASRWLSSELDSRKCSFWIGIQESSQSKINFASCDTFSQFENPTIQKPLSPFLTTFYIMKLTFTTAFTFALLCVVPTSAQRGAIRGSITPNTNRRLKDDKDSPDSNDGPALSGTVGSDFDGEVITMTNEETGQVYAMILPSEEGNEDEEVGEGGLLERHACVSHQHALDFIARYTVQNIEHDEECINEPDSCGGCCRMGYQLTWYVYHVLVNRIVAWLYAICSYTISNRTSALSLSLLPLQRRRQHVPTPSLYL